MENNTNNENLNKENSFDESQEVANVNTTENSVISEPTEQEEEETQDKKTISFEQADISGFSKDETISYLKEITQQYDINIIKDTVEEVKNHFYKIHRTEIAEKRQKFIDDGGLAEDFNFDDKLEPEFKELYKSFKTKKAEQSKKIEKEKQDNLKRRNEIIKQIKDLINKEESIEQTFKEFRALQEAWKEIGMVPQAELKNIWETYHHHVSAFYDYIKINKDLRDLDLKKNQESKIALCEKAEELILKESVVKAFADLQELHNQWREIGPVPKEKKDELWERFKAATTQINKKHQDYFVQIKEQEKKNLDAKTLICEKIEEITKEIPSNTKAWLDKSNEIIEFQKVWKTIGYAPKKYNTEIYERFRKACDDFFTAKREFFQEIKDVEEQNKQKKIDLCIHAESLAESTDWKQTTTDLIKLQKEWKTIGQVARKDSEKLWKRFRAACDKFFELKESHFASFEIEQKENLTKKQEIISQIEAFELTDNQEESLTALKNFQKDWTEIGFVPIKEKDSIQNRYREALNKKFDELKIDNEKKKELKFKVRLENIKQGKDSDNKLYSERQKLHNKLKAIQNDIVTLENNIGFFSNSKNAKSLISDVEKKIEKGKKDIELIKKQLRLLNEAEDN